MFRFILLVGIGLMLFLISGCNDTPNSVGRSSQNKADYGVVHIDTFYATNHSSDTNLIYTSSIDRFMLGKYQTSQGQTYQAWACLKFYSWPDSLLIGASVKSITSATIQLKGAYHFGNSLAPLSFDAYRAKVRLANDSLTYDSLYNNPTYYYNSSPLSVQTTITGSGDTASISIKILDVAMLNDWFSTNTDTTNLNDGLVLKPNNNTNVIKGFYSFNADTSLQPILIINYIDTNNVPQQSPPLKVGLSRYVSTVSGLITDNNLMYVQNGISYRGLVSFDSISKISTNWPVSIYRAVLQLTLNSTQSSAQFTPFAHDSLYALSVGTNEKSDGASYGMSQRNDSTGRPVYSFEIRQIAIRLLSNASIRKVALSGYFESGSFDLHSLYGAISEKKLKPRIIITYSVQR